MKLMLVVMAVVLGGCASVPAPRLFIDNEFNPAGAKTVSVKVDCTETYVDNIDSKLLPDFCQMLEASTKAAIKTRTEYTVIGDPADMDIIVKLKELNGGNPSLRFFVGFGAGKSTIMVYTDIIQKNKIMAEARMIETATQVNPMMGLWSNESILHQDIPIISNDIADFVANPKEF